MTTSGPVDTILSALQERAKELTCLYRVHEICNRSDEPLDVILHEIAEAIPPGFQFPSGCWSRVVIENAVYGPVDRAATAWSLSAPVRVEGEVVGRVEVFYTEEFPASDEGPFLGQERKLIDTIGERIGQLLLHRRLLVPFQTWKAGTEQGKREEWWVIVEFLRRTDHHLLVRIARRMINYLCWSGVAAAQDLLPKFTGVGNRNEPEDENRPSERRSLDAILQVADDTFRIAEANLAPTETLSLIQKWIKDDRAGFLVEAVENAGNSLADVSHALERYRHSGILDDELSRTIQIGLRVALARRFLTNNLEFINSAKNAISVSDFAELSRRVISPPKSHGKLGGKSSGLLLAAQIVRKSPEYADTLGNVKIPKTWYVTSDGVLNFIEHNQLQDLYNRKYLEIDQVRREYPHIIQIFKNSHFPPELLKGLSLALDDFEERPLIVRSSSLLEDQVGAAFSGKYKSLFLANRGSKAERLAALVDAIAEVYASIFGPDPIEYRAERGLLDVNEEMGILIQEVVGTQVGRWFFPTFAGVAFSRNELRWSARIKRDDGLLRLVPGLGTRAVDRLGDDYPVLIAPGQPGLRVNVSPDEILRYAPRKMDVIDVVDRRFKTVDLDDVLRSVGEGIPGIEMLVSVADESGVHRPYLIDWESRAARLVVTFEGLVSGTPFIAQMRSLLKLLSEKTGGPIDIEFASNGKDFYLLQCRPQSFTEQATGDLIPVDIPPDKVVFTARRFVTNGKVPDLTHVVYVDPDGYAAIPDYEKLLRVGRAVGRLNKLLPKRRFALLGPGRWGSRGDVKLGVSVGYADINNTALLVEIARRRGNYVPDLSFGTHFFQDLVESSIRYLPLFPDDEGVVFAERFLAGSPSILADLAPEFSDLSAVVRVVDVMRAAEGQVLRVLANADQETAVAFLTPPTGGLEPGGRRVAEPAPEDNARWRLQMAQRLAAEADAARLGIVAMYVFGSVRKGTATTTDDLDLLVHFRGEPAQRERLEAWLDGWSACLSELNFLRSGVRRERLIDVNIVTDAEVDARAGLAAKITEGKALRLELAEG